MSTSSSALFKEFNRVYFEFLEFIKTRTTDPKFGTFHQRNRLIRDTNVKMIIDTWLKRMAKPHYERIMSRDVSFLLEFEIESVNSHERMVADNCKYFKVLYQTMDAQHQPQFVEYVVQLTDLSSQYFNAKHSTKQF